MLKRADLQDAYHVRAIWDPEAKVWASQAEIPGLVLETETLGELSATLPFEGLRHSW